MQFSVPGTGPRITTVGQLTEAVDASELDPMAEIGIGLFVPDALLPRMHGHRCDYARFLRDQYGLWGGEGLYLATNDIVHDGVGNGLPDNTLTILPEFETAFRLGAIRRSTCICSLTVPAQVEEEPLLDAVFNETPTWNMLRRALLHRAAPGGRIMFQPSRAAKPEAVAVDYRTTAGPTVYLALTRPMLDAIAAS